MSPRGFAQGGSFDARPRDAEDRASLVMGHPPLMPSTGAYGEQDDSEAGGHAPIL